MSKEIPIQLSVEELVVIITALQARITKCSQQAATCDSNEDAGWWIRQTAHARILHDTLYATWAKNAP